MRIKQVCSILLILSVEFAHPFELSPVYVVNDCNKGMHNDNKPKGSLLILMKLQSFFLVKLEFLYNLPKKIIQNR